MKDLSWILEALPVGVWVGKLPDGELTYANPEFRTILGMGAVAGIGIGEAPRAYGLFDRAGRPYPAEQFPYSRVAATGRPATADDVVIRRHDGRSVHVRAVGYPVFEADGAMTHVVVAFVDITREVQADVERRQTEDRLSFAMGHSPVVIWSIDGAGVIRLSEGAGLAALGVKSGDLVGQSVFDLYREHPTIPGYIRRALEGESLRYSVQVGEATYDTWMAPMRDAAGGITGAVGLSHDVSDVRRLEALAIQNDRIAALGTLAASVAHEINNPLTFMLGHAQMLTSALAKFEQLVAPGTAPSPETLAAGLVTLRESIEPIHAGAERIAKIAGDLRTFARSKVDTTGAVDLCAVTNSVLRLLKKDLEARARLTTALRETALVRGDASRLVQVVLNLLMNAMQALPGGRPEHHQIEVSVGNEGAWVVVEVSDSGPGVPTIARERVFEPFFTTKEVGEGTGLGLFVCRNIVRGYSGEVSVHDRPGGGALFRVRLPAARELTTSGPMVPSARPQARPTESSGPQGARILVIDDDSLVGLALCSQLTAAGYRAELQQDAERAVAALRRDRERYDLIYCDLMMPGMTGMDLAEELDNELVMRVVFMTGGAFTPRSRDFVQAHPDRVLHKPFDVVGETVRRLAT